MLKFILSLPAIAFLAIGGFCFVGAAYYVEIDAILSAMALFAGVLSVVATAVYAIEVKPWIN